MTKTKYRKKKIGYRDTEIQKERKGAERKKQDAGDVIEEKEELGAGDETERYK